MTEESTATGSSSSLPPVIAIDGPSGAGKGTVSSRIALKLGFNLLDSGAIYRAAALHVINSDIDPSNEAAVLASLESLKAEFRLLDAHSEMGVFLDNVDVTQQLRDQATAEMASQVAVLPQVRAQLLQKQRDFRQAPGLVADGRDMGTVVFPDAQVKVFLTASAQTRANRRAKQLKDKGIAFKMSSLLEEIELRDERDSTRQHSPLVPAAGALQIDSSALTVDQVVAIIIEAHGNSVV